MLSLRQPALDWLKLAQGMGVRAASADTAEEFARLLRVALDGSGPYLIEARILDRPAASGTINPSTKTREA